MPALSKLVGVRVATETAPEKSQNDLLTKQRAARRQFPPQDDAASEGG